MAITAPTPMMMPSMVRLERSLFRAKARMAIRMICIRSIKFHYAARGGDVGIDLPQLHQAVERPCGLSILINRLTGQHLACFRINTVCQSPYDLQRFLNFHVSASCGPRFYPAHTLD